MAPRYTPLSSRVFVSSSIIFAERATKLLKAAVIFCLSCLQHHTAAVVHPTFSFIAGPRLTSDGVQTNPSDAGPGAGAAPPDGCQPIEQRQAVGLA
jgi:hypothetical protein